MSEKPVEDQLSAIASELVWDLVDRLGEIGDLSGIPAGAWDDFEKWAVSETLRVLKLARELPNASER